MTDAPPWQKGNTRSHVQGFSQGVTRPWARFLAKEMDFVLINLPMSIWYCMRMLSGDYGLMEQNPLDPSILLRSYLLIPLVFSVFFVLIEAWLIAFFGTTPGKALMGIRLLDADDDLKPSFFTSLRRSAGCIFWGNALMISYVQILAMILSWNRLQKHGITRWDEKTGIDYQTSSVGALNWIVTVGIILLAVSIPMALIMKYSFSLMTDY